MEKVKVKLFFTLIITLLLGICVLCAIRGIGSAKLILKGNEYSKLIQVATKYEGQPYKFGGNSPSTGFDCSGMVQYCYLQIGIKLSRTAQTQYDQSIKVSANKAKPGDLVFFKDTYKCPDYITHVGIYVGNNKMYQAGSSGIGYIDLTNLYYKKHLVGFGRIKR